MIVIIYKANVLQEGWAPRACRVCGTQLKRKVLRRAPAKSRRDLR